MLPHPINDLGKKIDGEAVVLGSFAAVCRRLFGEQLVKYSWILVLPQSYYLVLSQSRTLYYPRIRKYQSRVRKIIKEKPGPLRPRFFSPSYREDGPRGRTRAKSRFANGAAAAERKRKSRQTDGRTRAEAETRTAAAAEIKKRGAERDRGHSSFPRG